MVERVSEGRVRADETPRMRTRARASTKAPGKAAKPAKSPTKSKSAFDKKTIALVYDFDGTLSPRPMQDYALSLLHLSDPPRPY